MDEHNEPTQVGRPDGEWTIDQDLAIFRKVKRIIDSVPDHAYSRVAGYLMVVIRDRNDRTIIGAALGAVPGSPR